MLRISTLNKILICRLSSLGDILLVSPVIDAIKRKNSTLKIDFLVKQKFVDSIKFNPNIQNIIEYDSFDYIDLRKKIISEGYDLILDLQNNLRTKLLFIFIGIKKSSVNKPTFKKQLLVKLKINYFDKNFNIPSLYAEAAKLILSNQDRLSFYNNLGRVYRNSEAKNVIGFCPGAKHFTKIWPEEYFAELGNYLNKIGYKIFLFGGSLEKKVCERLQAKILNSIDYSNDNKLFSTADAMRNCELIITNDSALMHLAAAINIPIVAIFGSSVKEFGFSPFNVEHRIVENKELNCRPCSHIGRASCPQKHFKCMLDVKPKKVFNEIKWMLNTNE